VSFLDFTATGMNLFTAIEVFIPFRSFFLVAELSLLFGVLSLGVEILGLSMV
jgi:hypothetical protein